MAPAMIFCKEDMPFDSDLRTINKNLVETLHRSYSTALAVLGDATEAEAIVIDAIENIDAEDINSEALRDAVVLCLVQRCISTSKRI
jgi:hypothetical protein